MADTSSDETETREKRTRAWEIRQLKNVIKSSPPNQVLQYLKDNAVLADLFVGKVDPLIQPVNPICLAAQYGRVDLLPELIRLGFSADMVNSDRRGLQLQPIHLACYAGHFEFVETLVENYDVDLSSTDRFDARPLYWHIRNSDLNLALVKYLLERSAQVNVPNKINKMVLLHNAADLHDSYELCELLVQHGADVTAREFRGMTPLHLAASKGYIESARALLAAGADIEAVWIQKTTPFLFAVQCNRFPFACYLVTEGANPYVKDSYSRTVLHYAVLARSLKIVRHLILELNIFINSANADNRTPFCLAVQSGDLDIAKVLVAAGRAEVGLSLPVESWEKCGPEMSDFLKTVLSQPRSLQYLCVFEIRRALGRNIQNVDRLKLPFVLTDIIKLKHV